MDFSFYHLERHPFPAVQTAACLFWSPSHSAALETLAQGIEERHGFMALIGAAGVGKTSVLYAYLAQVDPKQLKTIFISDTRLPFRDMLTSIAEECGLECATDDVHVVADHLRKYLIEEYNQGRNVALIIDEAHNLPEQALWNLGMLSDLVEMSEENLLQIVLIGRPEFQRICNVPQLRRLQKRLVRYATLAPLTPQESMAYIQHHLRQVASPAGPVLTQRALKRIAHQAQGIPQTLNTMCTEVLIAGALDRQKPISAKFARQVLADVGPPKSSPLVRWGLAGAAALLLGLVIGLLQGTPYNTLVASYIGNLNLSTLLRGIVSVQQAEPPSDVALPAAQQAVALAPAQAPRLEARVADMPIPRVVAIPEGTAAMPAADGSTPISSPRGTEPAMADAQAVPTSLQPQSYDCLLQKLEGKPCAPQVARLSPHTATQPKTSLPETTTQPKTSMPETTTQPKTSPPETTTQPKTSMPATLPIQDSSPPPSQASSLPTEPDRAVEKPDHSSKPARSVSSKRLFSQTSPDTTGLFTTGVVCVAPRVPGKPGKDILLMDYTGHRVQHLITDGALNLAPALSPDGTTLAYTSYRDSRPNIYLRNLETGQESRLTYGSGVALSGAWAPNGLYLALSDSVDGNSDIFLYDVRKRQLRRLTTHSGMDVAPSFAPDSTRLVFTSDRSGASQLYLTDVGGRPPVLLTQRGLANTSPAWAPHGETIAFIGQSADVALDLFVIQADGTGLRRLTRGQQFHHAPAWAPEGHFVMGTSLRGTVWERYLVQVDSTRGARLLPPTGPVCLASQWVAQRVP